jgi:hypothetical protein
MFSHAFFQNSRVISTLGSGSVFVIRIQIRIWQILMILQMLDVFLLNSSSKVLTEKSTVIEH